MITRQDYLNTLNILKDQNLIKVLTGMRRVGKSTILELFRKQLEKDLVPLKNIQHYNFEEKKNLDLLDWVKLHDHIENKLIPKKMNYIFLDEIQIVNNFEKLIDSLFVKKNVDLYITGSNATLLSGELATLLTGRVFSINILPFSFVEYAALTKKPFNSDSFNSYINSSMLPEAIKLAQKSNDLWINYLNDIYDAILKKDIMIRNKLKNPDDFDKIFSFCLSQVGSLISARSITDELNRNTGDCISHHTVERYLQFMSDTFLLYRCEKYDVKGKKLLQSNYKYYVSDLGLRQIKLSDSIKDDLGHKLENIVYFELLRKNKGTVYIGKNYNKEIDFIVQNPNNEKKYYQVSWTTYSEQTLDRELEPLYQIHDNYPKFLITTDPENTTINGIRKINVIDWLLNGD